MTTLLLTFVIGLIGGAFAGSVVGFFFGFKRGCANGNYYAGAFWKRKIETERQ
jgi:hypothetical protein